MRGAERTLRAGVIALALVVATSAWADVPRLVLTHADLRRAIAPARVTPAAATARVTPPSVGRVAELAQRATGRLQKLLARVTGTSTSARNHRGQRGTGALAKLTLLRF
jgi:hypothetical protein